MIEFSSNSMDFPKYKEKINGIHKLCDTNEENFLKEFKEQFKVADKKEGLKFMGKIIQKLIYDEN